MAFVYGGTMPSYEICYLHHDGSLACTFSALCPDDLRAKILAHAMKISAYKRFEVWRGQSLVYERPQQFEPAAFVPDTEVLPRDYRRGSPAQQSFA